MIHSVYEVETAKIAIKFSVDTLPINKQSLLLSGYIVLILC